MANSKATDTTLPADKGAAIELTCVQAHPCIHSYGVGRRFRVFPGKPTLVKADERHALEQDEHFRRAFHEGRIGVRVVAASELASYDEGRTIDHGYDPAPPPAVLGVDTDVGVFLNDPKAPTPLDQLHPEAAELAKARGVTTQQFLAERDQRQRKQVESQQARMSLGPDGKKGTTKSTSGKSDA